MNCDRNIYKKKKTIIEIGIEEQFFFFFFLMQ